MTLPQRMTLGQWMDRALIASVGLIFWYGAREVDRMGDKVDKLQTTIAAVVERVDNTRSELDDLRTQFEERILAQKAQITRDEKRKPTFGWRNQ